MMAVWPEAGGVEKMGFKVRTGGKAALPPATYASDFSQIQLSII